MPCGRRRKSKRVDLDDVENLKLIEVVKQLTGGLMANIQDLQNKLAEVKASLVGFNTKIDNFSSEVDSAFNRLEQKIAIGAETQPAIDELNTMAGTIATKSAELDLKIAEAQVRGI